jgi:hypothetical protein
LQHQTTIPSWAYCKWLKSLLWSSYVLSAS